MPEDILDAAQKIIDDAAKKVETPPATTVPLEPPPAPMTTPSPDAAKLVESILEPGSQSTIVAPPKPDHVPPPQLPKRGISGILVALLLLIVGGSVVAGSYYVSQRQQLADTRSLAKETDCRNDGVGCKDEYICTKYDDGTYGCKGGSPAATNTPRPAATNTPRPIATNTPKPPAWDDINPGCTINPNSCEDGFSCHCQNGNACTSYKCEADSTAKDFCKADKRDYCINQGGKAFTCCEKGYSCCVGYNGCCKNSGGGGGGGGGGGACTDIRIYKGTTQVTPSTLAPGDAIKLAVKGSGSPSKAHFRVNGGAWMETSTTVAGWFTQDYTIPIGVTDFVIEAEVFVDGVWK